MGCMLKVLHALFLKLYSIAETSPTNSEPQEEEDFFLDKNSAQEGNKEQVQSFFYVTFTTNTFIKSMLFSFHIVLLVVFFLH